jgi:hypothetical protein
MLAIFAGVLYAVFYLFATGVVSYYSSADLSQFAAIPYVSVHLGKEIGFYPWIILYPTSNMVISLPFWTLISTVFLAFLVSCNTALAAYSIRLRSTNGTKIFGIMIGGAVPATFGIVGCCSPTLVIFLGMLSLTSILWKLTPYLTIGSFFLLSAGIYYTAKATINCERRNR